MNVMTLFDWVAKWLPMLLWMVIIFLASHQPADNLPLFGTWDLLVKKGGHFLAYAVLAILARRVMEGSSYPVVWALVITAVYATSDEFHQTFVLGRTGTPIDVMIDCLGGITGLAVYEGFLSKLNG